MIKSLYTRVVVAFIVAVMIGLVGSLLVTNRMFEKQMHDWIRDDTSRSAEGIMEILRESDPGRWDLILQRFADMKSSYIAIYDASGNRQVSSSLAFTVSDDQVGQVLSGGSYLEFMDNRNHELPAWLMGFQVKRGTDTFALFIQPNYLTISQSIKRTIQLNLLIVLILGGLVMVVAARYLVKPLNMLTKATRELAKGNFNVQMSLKRNDEIGILTQSFDEMTNELKQLEQMRQDFVSNVSHEIQSPLTSIIGFTKALKSSAMPAAERMYYLDIIQSESERLSRLSDNLLKLASLESKHHPFQKATYRLDEQIRHVVVVCEPLWSAKRLNLELNLPKTILAADEDLMKQVWINLLGNSIKFTPEGGTIRVRAAAEVHQVKVIIADTGIGIPEAELSMIFHQFYKADRSRTGATEGSGLGLSLVRKIVSMHKGTIQVSSKEGEGTTVTVRLPSSV
ncbi:sensor histidine kinase [Paenibacillus sp. OAS669]|uniref:HAMP domain-containing sensor histidine kinase n=1 Tax=Paenibacillus sp. OAS669 TaxID=2663821 RepID=UPI0017898AD7|nr:HAMP domain-containing sensor histidine kinase [Paenibacillus sp. OAS669]MBE1444006.1 signal transduction histidine kinase [Paenibacillus sp. OAS669]